MPDFLLEIGCEEIPAGMIANAVRQHVTGGARPSAAQRLARLARAAASDEEATEAVRRALEEILT